MTQTDAQPARTIFVIGATGNQGGGLVGHLTGFKGLARPRHDESP